MIKRFASVALALAVGAFVAGTPVAHAQAVPVSDLVAFTGAAAITADNVGGCGDAADLLGPETPHVDLAGGCGSFNFASTVCAGTSTDDPVGETGLCNIGTLGSFLNTVCGTGSATGTGNIGGAGGETGTVTAFNITFIATIGVVTGTSVSDDTDSLLGVVQLGPGGTGPLPDGPPDCTNGFEVTGVVAATS